MSSKFFSVLTDSLDRVREVEVLVVGLGSLLVSNGLVDVATKSIVKNGGKLHRSSKSLPLEKLN